MHHILATLNFIPRRSNRRKSRFSQHSVLECLERRELLAADVSVLKDIAAGDASGVPPWLVDRETVAEYNGLVYFSANGGTEGMELWTTDGTEENTELFVDVLPGIGQSSPGNLTVAIGKLFFTAGSPRGTYVTDGTQAGTTLLMDVPFQGFLGEFGSTAYFYGGTQANPSGIWKTDGTGPGTIMIANMQVGRNQSLIFDNSIYFTSKSIAIPSQENSLWRLNPDNDAIQEVPGSPVDVFYLQVFAGKLYFSGDVDPSVSNSPSFLWKMDSGTSTPALVQDSNSVRFANTPQIKIEVAGVLYFAAGSPAEGFELWRTDGTSDGTILVKDIYPGSNSSVPGLLIAAADTLYFVANDGLHGFELWRSDGTDAGTFLVKDIATGPDNAETAQLVNLNGLVVFTARSSQSVPAVLWTSGGTEAGTSPVNSTVVDLADNFVQLGSSLVFLGQNTTVGREMFIFHTGEQPAAPVITGPTGNISSLRPTVTWTAVGTATEYEVWISNNSTGENPLIRQIVSATSFTPSSDLGIGKFTVWVRTLGANGGPPSKWSLQVSFRVKAPVIQLPVTTDPANGFGMLSWQALPGAVKYDVWIDRLDVPTAQIYRNTNVSGTSVTPTSLPNGGRYRVWVRGLAADGADGAWSLSQDFVENQVPAITGGLNPTFDTTPTISWTAVPGAASYEVYVRSINGNFKALHQKNIAGTSFTWPGLPAGPYEYWVRVTGATVWSVPVDLRTDGRTNVLSPTGSTANRRPEISWRPVDQAVRYELWVDQLGVDEKIIYQTNLTSTSFTPPSNLPLGNYRIWVRAVGSTTTALWSPSVNFTIADASTPVTQGADFDLLASVFSDSLLLAVLGTTQPLVIPSSMQNDAPEEPRTNAIVLSINGTSQSEDTESPHEHIKA